MHLYKKWSVFSQYWSGLAWDSKIWWFVSRSQHSQWVVRTVLVYYFTILKYHFTDFTLTNRRWSNRCWRIRSQCCLLMKCCSCQWLVMPIWRLSNPWELSLRYAALDGSKSIPAVSKFSCIFELSTSLSFASYCQNSHYNLKTRSQIVHSKHLRSLPRVPSPQLVFFFQFLNFLIFYFKVF